MTPGSPEAPEGRAAAESAAVKEALVRFYSGTWATLEKDFLGPEVGVRSEAFFRETEAIRYRLYPYLPSLVGFERWAGRRVLEIGTGMGVDHARFARAGARLAGVDLTPGHLQITASRLAREGLASRLLQGDAERLPFREASFDHVYSCGVLFLVPDIQRAVDEVHRILAPGGEALVMLYHRTSLHHYLKTLAFMGLVWGDGLYLSRQKLVDWSADGYDYPIIRLYSRRQARHLFRRFAEVRMGVRTLTPAEFPVIGERLPTDFLEFVARRLGFFLFVRAVKG
jgi:ubiquinone/menaquinone biosynthesis C-methylase UbiE